MLQNNSLLAQLKQGIRANTPRVQGIIKATDKGFGFLEAEDGTSYFISPPAMKQVVHGDRIEAVIKKDGDKKQADPETLIKASLDRFVARVQKYDDGRLAVIPDHPLINLLLKARLKHSLKASDISDGDWIVAHLIRHPLRPDDKGFFAQIDELVVKNDDPTVPWRVTLARHALEQECPPAADEWPLQDEGLVREDLTAEPFFTIDGKKTRDMDDALRVEVTDDGWMMTVAIADPTAYVDESHPADQEARTRAFTVYLPGQNITMLPEALADDLCSLKPNVDRPVLACRLHIGRHGMLGKYRFFAATIRSQARLAYDDVSDWIEKSFSAKAPTATIAEQLKALTDLALARTAWREANTLVFKDRPDYTFDLDDVGNVLDIVIEKRRIGQRMIEEAMIVANACCADLLAKKIGHGIFNVHSAFKPEKIDQAVEFLTTQDITVEREQLAELSHYKELRRMLDAREDAWLNARLRRFQGYTNMSARPGPHFGLGLPAYATWTSPIRKYGDMVNHRLIKQALKSETAPSETSQQLTEQLAERRRLSRMAERDVKDWLYVRYLSAAIEKCEVFDADIIDVRRGGMSVRLTANGATAFVPAPLIHRDRSQVAIDDKEGFIRINGELRYRLGGSLLVKLVEAREVTRSLVAAPTE